MGLEILISDPTVTLEDKKFRWTAAYNNAVFMFTRPQLGTATFSTDMTGNKITFTRLLTANEILGLSTFPIGMTNEGADVTVDFVSSTTSGGVTVVYFSASFIVQFQLANNPNNVYTISSEAGASSGPNYRLEVSVFSGAKSATGYWTPDGRGNTRVDVVSFLRTIVDKTNLSAPYTVGFREMWDGSDEPMTIIPYTFYVSFSAMQLGATYGSNMVRYTYMGQLAAGFQAQYLTAFTKPKQFQGLPFGLSYIMTEYMSSIPVGDLKIERTEIDESGSVLLNSTIDITEREAGIYETPQYNPSNPLTSTVVYRIFQVVGGDQVTMLTKEVSYISTCEGDPFVFLKWINSLGGTEYYRFGYDQVKSMVTTNDVTVTRFVSDWSSDNTIDDVVFKSVSNRIQFGETGVDDPGIDSLPKSIDVKMMFRSDEPGVSLFHTVIISPGTFQTGRTRNRLRDVSYTATLPDFNIQSK